MNQCKLFLGILAPGFLFLQSCSNGESHVKMTEINMDSVKAKVIVLESALFAASNAKNADDAANFYSADAQSLANNEPLRVGKDAIRMGMKKDFAADTSGNTMTFETTGVWAAGNYVTETGSMAAKDKSGKIVYRGKYMTLFELRDGKYVCIRDIWNDDSSN